MNNIDKYIIKKIFTVLPVFIVSLVFLICLITYIVDIFVLGNSNLQSVGFLKVMYYYFICTFATFNIIISVLSFISVALISMMLCDKNEIVACFSLGIGYKRFLKPFFISAVFLMKVMLIFEGWVIPEVNRIREELDYKYFGIGSRMYGANIHMKLKNNKYIYIEYFSKYSNTGNNVIIDTIVGRRLLSRFRAESISWNDDRCMWVFNKWESREFGESEDVVNSGDEIELSNIDLIPSDLVFDETFQTKLNSPSLNKFVSRLDKSGIDSKMFKIEQVKRVARPLMVFLSALVGILFYSRKRRDGNLLMVFLGFVVACAITVSSIIAEDLAIYSNLNIYAVFIVPLLFFSFINYLMYRFYL